MKISFLLDHAYGVGGAIRATISTANALAGIGHQVEILSVKRQRDEPSFAIDNGVTITPIVDLRDVDAFSEADSRLYAEEPKVLPRSEAVFKAYNALLESRVKQTLSGIDTDVLIGTRMGLNTYIAKFAPAKLPRVGMAHTTFSYYNGPSLADELTALRRLDAMITVATGDVPIWRRHLKEAGTRVTGIPNCVAPSQLPQAELDTKTIVAVGRLVGVKQFHLLIRSFALVAQKYPDWKLRIYGRGAAKAGLRDLIFKLGLHNRVFLMGAVTPIEPEWAKASIAAVTSRLESFHIGLVEAQQLGVPVVSMACERGPLDIITPDSDGVLTPVNDVDAFADGLLRVIDNAALAKRLSTNGRRTATRFYPQAVAKQYNKFLTKLVRDKSGRAALRTARSRAAVTAASPATVTAAPVLDCYVPTHNRILQVTGADPKRAKLTLIQQGKQRKKIVLNCSHGTAEVPVTTALAEGTYEVWVASEGREVRAAAGTLDLRGLIGRTDLTGHRLCHIVPYRDAKGFLVLRSWRRVVHAEADEVDFGDGTIAVTGRLYGKFSSDSQLSALAVCRQLPDRPVSVDASLDPSGEFGFSIDTASLAHSGASADPQLWDLSLTLTNAVEPMAKPIRIMRVLDDIAERKAIFVYPPTRLADDYASEAIVYYTDHNGLSIRVTPTLPVHPVLNLCGHH